MEILKIILTIILMTTVSHAGLGEKTLNIKTNKKLTEEIKDYQLFYFWATWCPDCKDKLNSDLSFYLNQSKLSFVTISIEKDKEKVEAYLDKNKITLPAYYDATKELQKQFKVFTVPSAVLTQKKGASFEVVQAITGKDWSEIDAQIKKITKE